MDQTPKTKKTKTTFNVPALKEYMREEITYDEASQKLIDMDTLTDKLTGEETAEALSILERLMKRKYKCNNSNSHTITDVSHFL